MNAELRPGRKQRGKTVFEDAAARLRRPSFDVSEGFL